MSKSYFISSIEDIKDRRVCNNKFVHSNECWLVSHQLKILEMKGYEVINSLDLCGLVCFHSMMYTRRNKDVRACPYFEEFMEFIILTNWNTEDQRVWNNKFSPLELKFISYQNCLCWLSCDIVRYTRRWITTSCFYLIMSDWMVWRNKFAHWQWNSKKAYFL